MERTCTLFMIHDELPTEFRSSFYVLCQFLEEMNCQMVDEEVCVNRRVTICRRRRPFGVLGGGGLSGGGGGLGGGGGKCRFEIVKRCVLRKRQVCGSTAAGADGQEMTGANCTLTTKEVCGPKPVSVERLHKGRTCQAEPIRACQQVPIKTCRNVCQTRSGRAGGLFKQAYKCELAPQRQCVRVRDPAAAQCPPSSCKPAQIEVRLS